ncbi:hypothetical protein TW95_gp0400 [Pandoravirus inopinatum]|uniref:DUF5900 domain-containing protein n=1 Tax=Pandoravirus inopinatum TaxID=1605721 RepID=A0A0B5J0Y8_9VIRU|nr:hypothetical protein TW95_gp0400 [Pandoravirus inopinatum]AJF97134.1 hypothetical protein [Pandoravirus inopinatum]
MTDEMRALVLAATFAVGTLVACFAPIEAFLDDEIPCAIVAAAAAFAIYLSWILSASLARRRKTKSASRRSHADTLRPAVDTPPCTTADIVVDNDNVKDCATPQCPPVLPLQRVDFAVHPFGFDPYLDTVPRGALGMCEPISPQVDARWWRTFKASIIARYGGPLSFALACEVHPDRLDQDRWARHVNINDDRDGDQLQVVIGKVVHGGTNWIVTRGQFVKSDGQLVPHGYAVRQWHTGMTNEGLWHRGTWVQGYIYSPPVHGRDATTHRVHGGLPDKIDFSVTWHTWDAHGRPGRHVRYCGPSTARRSGMPRNQWPHAQWPICYGGWTPTGACATCVCRFHNGDQYVQVSDGNGVPTILYYYIDSLPRGQLIGNCAWTIIAAQPDAAYGGAVFYPADVGSPQFEAMAHYVLSGRSAEAFSPAQQAAFVAAIRTAQTV